MAGGALGVDVKRAGQEIRRGLAAMASGAGAGAVAIGNRRAALGIEIGRDADVGGAVHMGGAVMTGSADWVDRAEAEGGVRQMSAHIRRLSVTGGATLRWWRRGLGVQDIHNGLNFVRGQETKRAHAAGVVADSCLNGRRGGWYLGGIGQITVAACTVLSV